VTAWLLMLLGAPATGEESGESGGATAAAAAPAAPAQEPLPAADTVADATLRQDTSTLPPSDSLLVSDTADVDLERSTAEAASTIRQLWRSFAALVPKILIALGLIGLAALLTSVVRPLLRRMLGSWARADATAALTGVVIWILAISVGLSVIVGDPRTLLGSAGLIGLGLSWALQQPIESFTAWLLNSFRGYYRVGDRIAVGEVFGDVYRIDFLTTTVWEAGGPDKPVQGAQPTGALVTFPNSEVLRANVINYTRDFPYVWDEVDVGLTNESDLTYARGVLLDVAARVVGEAMKRPIALYRGMLERASLDFDIADEPQVFFSAERSWTNATIRYLVEARRRRGAASDLLLALSRELARDEHRGRMTMAYPTARVSLVPPEETAGS
jgi:small-conductance mechanosensitive channel